MVLSYSIYFVYFLLIVLVINYVLTVEWHRDK
nr:MAG TPA: hypothetical protein [Caudoviricetes sp.]